MRCDEHKTSHAGQNNPHFSLSTDTRWNLVSVDNENDFMQCIDALFRQYKVTLY